MVHDRADRVDPAERVCTGIEGLDEVLNGGLVPHQTYLVRGGPGTGKTTLGLHFLTTGVANQETSLFINLGEAAAQIQRNARSSGISTAGISFLDLSPTSEFFTTNQTYDIFSPAEVEREPITQQIIEQIETLKPDRVFLDSITQFRYLTSDAFQFRRQVLSFLRFLMEHDATVLFTSESSEEAPDSDLQFLCDGVIHLNFTPKYRTLHISKFRGSNFQNGHHSLRITDRGVQVFPRLRPELHKRNFHPEPISSGIPDLDALLHGGLERGTVTIISGPSGVGKTTIGLQFMKEAAGRGERSIVYTFEEEVEIILQRCESVNIPARTMLERGTLTLQKIEPLQFTPDEFAQLVRHSAEAQQTQIVMLDSISGYRLSVQGDDLVSHIHSLCKYLANTGITVLLINETEKIAGEFRATEVGITYLADNFVFMRYLERRIGGELHIRKAIGVLKKRLSDFEKTLREVEITRYGIKVGEPMEGLEGILSDTPFLREKE
ncbi:ATPase domain-containing protein [Egbenema bharatensis]|uniref:ATPase domain-containing protein n=1 Tax=Egbenema bharatensis TaxID=3463334 RepID=UPI003A844B63